MKNVVFLNNDYYLGSALEQVSSKLPSGWTCELKHDKNGGDISKTLLLITSPNKVTSKKVLIADNNFQRKTLLNIFKQNKVAFKDSMFVVSRFISPKLQDFCANSGVSFADSTGNVFFENLDPPIFLHSNGASTNPFRRKDGILRSLRGRPSARVVRTLIDFRPPFGIRELSARSRTSLGSTARVVDLLVKEEIVQKNSKGKIEQYNWITLLERWSEDYAFQKTNKTQLFLAPRGLQNVVEKLKKSSFQYAVTGNLALEQIVPNTDSRLGTIFVSDIAQAQSDLDIYPVDEAGNLMLAVPFDRVLFERSWQRQKVNYVALSQVCIDLLTSPGRSPSDCKYLLEWMKKNERTWRA